MAEFDTSSYPKPTAGPSAIDTIGKLQGLQQQKQQIESGALTIDKQKLDLVNQGFQYLIREVNAIDPTTATPEDFFRIGQNAVNQKFLTPEAYANFAKTIPANKVEIPKFKNEFLQRAMTTQEAINWHYGNQGTLNTGQTIQPVATSPKPGFGGIRSTGLPIQQQVPPTAKGVTPEGQPAFVGPQVPQVAAGAVAAPPMTGMPVESIPGPINNPAIKGPSANFGGTVTGAEVGPNTAPSANRVTADRFPNVPRGIPVGMPPLFEEGRKQYVEDQNLATQKLTAIKPALQAIPLIKGLTTGIGTETYNKALAGLSNLGLVPEGVTNKVAIYQELNKKLANYVSSNPVGQRSDAAQVLAEASSPSPKTQINPALIKLTKDAIVLDRIQAARAAAFEGGDFNKYGQHRSTFPAKMDERAFGFDLMEPKERKDLLISMNKKLNSSKASERAEAARFKKSLETVDKLGYLDLSLE